MSVSIAKFGLIRSFTKRNCGTAGTEFAIAAPFVLLAVLVMADLGLAIGQQINLDQSVRAGAEFTMNGVDDKDDVQEIVAAAATGYSANEAEDVGKSRPIVAVTEVCRCPGSGTEVSCSTDCGGVSPSRYFSITATEKYDPIFISELDLKASVQVQVE